MTPATIRETRERAGLTVAELATLLGVDRTTVYRWELPEANPRARRPHGLYRGIVEKWLARHERNERIERALNAQADERISRETP